MQQFVEHHNVEPLRSAIEYDGTPKEKLKGRDSLIFAERVRKLQHARKS